MEFGKNYSIKDVAKLAKVSIGTVDRVLHNRKGVSQNTRARVLAIIKETGYKKNIMASRLKLASNHTIQIAVLLPEILEDWSYWKSPQLGVTRALNELLESGVNIDYYYFNVHNPKSFSSKCTEIIEASYNAIVTVPFMELESNNLLKNATVPVVFLDTHRKLHNKANFIYQSSHEAGMVAARLLYNFIGTSGSYLVVNMIENGKVRINCRQREAGFRSFFQTNFPDQEFQIHSFNHGFDDDASLAQSLISSFTKNNVYGVFVTNSRVFMLANMIEKHLLVDIYLVGFDLNDKNIGLLKQQKIHYLINQKPDQQGYMAIMGLYKYLTEKDSSRLNTKIPVEIIVKENIPF